MMKREDALTIKCPCCSTEITVNPESGKTIHSAQVKPKLSMEEMVRNVKGGKDRVLNRFEEEKEKLKGRSVALDKLFKESVKKANEGD